MHHFLFQDNPSSIMLTKDKYCSIRGFTSENMTGCRMLWCCIYTIFFTTGWVSFYSTEFCTQVLMAKSTNVVRTRSIYAATGFVVYWLLFLIVALARHVLHQIMKERVKRLEAVDGEIRVDALAVFLYLMSVTFPMFCHIMKCVLLVQGAALWSWLGLVGAVYCLFVFYNNPDDYGLDEACASCSGVVVSLDGVDQDMIFVLHVILVFIMVVSSMIWKRRQRRIANSKAALFIIPTQKKQGIFFSI